MYQHSRSAEDILSPQESKDVVTRIIHTSLKLGQEVNLELRSNKEKDAHLHEAEATTPLHTTGLKYHTNARTLTASPPQRYGTSWPKAEAPDKYDYTPHSLYSNVPPSYPSTNQSTSDLATFLAKCDLITKGLGRFDDWPESYRAW